MEKSESIKELSAAMAVAQGQMPAVPMGSVNPFLHNKYANLGDVIKTAQPILAKNGLSYSQSVFTEDAKLGVETILMHSSGEWLSSRMAMNIGDTEKGLSSAQSAGKVITYLRRYTLSAMLGVYADEDADGNGNNVSAAKPTVQPAAHVPAPVKKSEPLPQLVEEPPMYDAERDFPPIDEMPLRYAPLALQAYIKKLSESFADIECNDKQDALMTSMMSAALGGVEDKRHELGFFLIGVSSMKEMSAGEKRALLKWLQPEKNAEGKYIPNGMAVREANAAYAYSVNALNAAEQPA